MSIDERVLDVAKRLARELASLKKGIKDEREKHQLALDEERASLAEELQRRKREATEEQSALAQERARLGMMDALVDDEVLTLNVGGCIFTTRRSTLCCCEASYLANLFSGRWDNSIEKDAEGRYFLDFDPISFHIVLNFLRSKCLAGAGPLPPPEVPADKEEHFRNLAEYLGLTCELAETTRSSSSKSQWAAKLLRQPQTAGVGQASAHSTAASSSARSTVLAAGTSQPSTASSAPPLSDKLRQPGWSTKVAHNAALIQTDDPLVVRIGNTRPLASAGAIRASRGFQAGVHKWTIEVLFCSDWSYVGLVADTWNAISVPIGRAAGSWGIASNGAVYAGRVEVAKLEQQYFTGSRITFILDMDALSRCAAVEINGKAFPAVFTDLPSLVYPAVSNCRSEAAYRLEFQ